MRGLLFSSMAIFLWTTSAWPQSSASVSIGPAPWTPPPGQHDRITPLEKHMGFLSKRITLALKAGKITKDQAKALRKKVTAVYESEQDAYRENGHRKLTESQEKKAYEVLNEAAQAVDAVLGAP